MGWWLAKADDQGRKDWLKRFDPRFWSANFPRPMMAAVVTTGPQALRVEIDFRKRDDLAGLIWESVDRFDHPLHAYETAKDYRGCALRFRWKSSGVAGLDAINGPVLTIEGRDAGGVARAWYVRLWNYAEGAPDDAEVAIDFASVEAGFSLPGEAVWAGDVDRMFVSMVPEGFDGTDAPLAGDGAAWVEMSEIACDGGGSTIAIGDGMVPPHGLRMSGGYDDSYHLTPARLLRGAVQLGYRALIDHYVGMSHWPAVAWDGGRFVAGGAGDVLCEPARVWHADFAARAAELGFKIVWSVSFELFDAYAPESWKQRDGEGAPALTGWSPPSTLLSPANGQAMDYVERALLAFAAIAENAGMPVAVQIGEPWWWTGFGEDRTPCFYDAAATALYLSETGLAVPAALSDARDPASPAQLAHMDWLGLVLGRATLALRDAVTAAYSGAEVLLLFYAPQVLDAAAPNLARVNMPVAWAHPAFDALEVEDYDFVIAGDVDAQARARAAVSGALGYPLAKQHYFSGFALTADEGPLWRRIAGAASAARRRGVAETFVWAWPQVARDGFTYFESSGALRQAQDEREIDVESFHDVRFPLDVGLGAEVTTGFSTTVFEAASGFEQRNSAWSDARLRFDAGLGVRSEADLQAVAAFFRARRGAAVGFRFRDPSDSSSNGAEGTPTAADQLVGTGDGVRTRFQLVKSYGEPGIDPQVRHITRPEAASVRVAVAGVEVTEGWSLEGGFIDFDTPPAIGAGVTAGFRFDVPVRFAEDKLEVSLATFRAGELPSVPLVEVREAADA